VVTLFTTRFNVKKNSAFCPLSVFMCFIWIWEHTAMISLCSVNWPVFVTEKKCVYCAVRAASLCVSHVNTGLWNKGRAQCRRRWHPKTIIVYNISKLNRYLVISRNKRDSIPRHWLTASRNVTLTWLGLQCVIYFENGSIDVRREFGREFVFVFLHNCFFWTLSYKYLRSYAQFAAVELPTKTHVNHQIPSILLKIHARGPCTLAEYNSLRNETK
jgi:hypothetical protein